MPPSAVPRARSGPLPLSDAREPASAGAPSRAVPSDHDLIRRVQRGDEDAFRLLVERHEERAVRVAASLVGSGEDARDLAQEAFLRVFRNVARFDFRHEFTTWLYRIVTNLGIDFLRRRRPSLSTSGTARDEEDELDLPDAEGEAPSRALEREETAARVRACIDRLAPHFRTVMVLRELEGLACTEIADIVGATHVTVRWRLHRGRKLFQDEWERMERAEGRPSAPSQAPSRPPHGGSGSDANDSPSPP